MSRKNPLKKFSPEKLSLIANRFKVLGEETRLKLLMLLQGGEFDVTTLVAKTDSTQANISKHLSILAGAGMIIRRKEGLHTFYSISDPVIFELCDLMCNRIDSEFQNSAALYSARK